MLNFLTNISIENYKSIKKLDFEPGRINVFIGNPNAGKSNILEAIALLGVEMGDKYFRDIINFENLDNLIYNQEIERLISIETNKTNAFLKYFKNDRIFALFQEKGENSKEIVNDFESKYEISKELHQKYASSEKMAYQYNYSEAKNNGGEAFNQFTSFHNKIRYYDFQKLNAYNDVFSQYLLSPFGSNLLSILKFKKEVLELINPIFEENGLKLDFSDTEHIIKVKKINTKDNFLFPYYVLSEKMQRLVFYLALIKSNKDASLLIKEPETKMFLPYLSLIAKELLNNSSNQYFITTQSSLFIKELSSSNELNLFVVSYKDGTKLKKLNQDEISNLLAYGVEMYSHLSEFE